MDNDRWKVRSSGQARTAANDPKVLLDDVWNKVLAPDRDLDDLIKVVKKTHPHLVGYIREAIDHLRAARTSLSMLRMKL